MLLQWHEESGDLEALQAEWSALLPRCATNTVFLTWEWQRAWWAAFGAEKHLRLLTTRDDDGNLQAIVPLFVQQTLLDPRAALPDINIENPLSLDQGESYQTLHLIGGSEVSDYLDILAPADVHAHTCAALLDALAEMEGWQIIDLHSLPAASPTVQILPEQARVHGWEVEVAREDVCPIIDLPATWDEYLAQRLDGKKRHELRRKMRKAERETDVNWYWVDTAELERGLQVFFELHRASHPDKEDFMTPRMEGFFRDIVHAAQERGWLRLAVLRYHAEAVASYLCFDYGGDRLIYNSGFDLSTYASLSPGVVLLGYMIHDAIQNGCGQFDFLQGDERYKYDFGATDTEVMRVFIRR